MAGENAQSRIYLGIHWHFDAVEGIRAGDGVGDYVFTHALIPLHGPRPKALPSMDPEAQIQLAISLEDVAAHGGLGSGKGGASTLAGSPDGNDDSNMNGLRQLAFAVTTPPAGSSFKPISIGLRQAAVQSDVGLAADLLSGQPVGQVDASPMQSTAPGNPLDDLDAAFASSDLLKLP
jgi:hypothetical protein